MSFFLRRKTSKYNQYHLQTRLRGHSGPIVRLLATEDGKFLASGASDGTKVWDLGAMRELVTPTSPEIRGATTALVWLKREDDLGEALFYGTQNGQLVCWKQAKQKGRVIFEELSCARLLKPAEITGLAFDAPSNRLAVCHRGGIVQIHSVSGTMSLTQIFSIELPAFVPRAVAFGQTNGNERDLMVFGLYGGNIYTLRGSEGKVVGQAWNVGAHIGDVASDARKGVLCMDDPSSGTNLYRLEDHTRVKSFPVAVTKSRRVRQVSFMSDCTSIVSGSDHGVVYIFDRRSGEVVDELSIFQNEWVQAIAAVECAGMSTVFAAKSRDAAAPTEIFVWRKRTHRRLSASMLCAALIFLQVLVLLVAIGALTLSYNIAIIPMYNI